MEIQSVPDWLRKLLLYLRAAAETKSMNWPGLPLLPKSIFPDLPSNRAAYNEFLLWIRQSLRLREARVVFDVGANHGVFARAASACFQDATVFLFEPLPNLRPLLESQARRHAGRWSFHPIALGAETGHLAFHVDPGDDAIGSFVGFSKSYDESYSQSHDRLASSQSTTIDVAIETLDNFCHENRIEHIDLLKIDVEGFEFAVLDGAKKMLLNTNAVVVETSLIRAIESGSAPLPDMINRLTGYGFYIVALLPSFASDVNGQRRPCEYNILARRFNS